MDSSVQPPLPQGAGYGVVVGFGVVFALGMVWVMRTMKKSFHEDNHSTETFMVANRSVGTGLIAAAVISSWLYSIALLGATLLTYRYGVALAVWWGASASTMVTFFSFIAIQVKRRAPNAHTLLELIKVRYGTTTHILWIVLCLVNNLFVFSTMLLSASTTVSSLTGMHVIASTFLMPIGVAMYTYLGGLRATFLTDYVHTFVIMIILAWFTIRVITVSEIGSIGNLYDAVMTVDRENPVDGNYQGSHLTMRSTQSVLFGILHIISNFGTITMDTGFWQKGFSAAPDAAVPGYVLGGIASFAPPYAIGTIVGLAAIALESTPAFPTYPRMMTADEVDAGLVLPYVAQAVAGKGGAAAILLVTFMACTSVASAQMIAISSIISFDIYGTYINKTATNRQLIRWSHIGVIFTSLAISSIATGFHLGGVNMTWLLYAMGNIVNPGVFPTLFALLWTRQTKVAATIAPFAGLIGGISVWLGTAHRLYGEVTITSTGATLPCLYGTIVAFVAPIPVSVLVSLVSPTEPFDWDDFKKIHTVKPDAIASEPPVDQQGREQDHWLTPERQSYMKKMSRWAAFWTCFTFVGHVLLWPLAMYGSKMVFSKPGTRNEREKAINPVDSDESNNGTKENMKGAV
ncbi:hypothetical protein TruAng_007497 [Truncatella angustata]|nr:hypothetical protein TruAng_007497 [Truncatella angustata]